MALPIYSFGIRLYGLLIRLVAPFNPKAKKWLSGRKDIWLKINSINNQRDSPVWIHVSSLGEFEQGRPVIEQIKRAFPNTPVVLTFFSPSGYEMRVNYQHADNIYYLPLDTRKNAERFINAVNPRLAIFVKYDFWFNYLNIL